MNTRRAENCRFEYEENVAVVGGRREPEIYRELTAEGRVLCAAAGVVEEALVLLLFGITFQMALLPVFLFLWFLMAALTAAALIGADALFSNAI